MTRPILCVKLISWAFQDFDNKVERNQPFVAESITGHLHNGHRQAPPENNIGILLADDQLVFLVISAPAVCWSVGLMMFYLLYRGGAVQSWVVQEHQDHHHQLNQRKKQIFLSWL